MLSEVEKVLLKYQWNTVPSVHGVSDALSHSKDAKENQFINRLEGIPWVQQEMITCSISLRR